MSTVIARRAALLASFLLASPLRALAAEPDRRLPPVDVSAIQAAEMEERPLRPPPKTFEIPILIYHHVIPGGGSPVLHVSPGGFEQQLQYLQSNGYQSVSSADLANCLEYGAPLPERPVILSFDDGWENQYQYAFPLLQKYGFTGTFYVVSGYLDHQNFMTTAQLKTMMAAGMVIGGHSRTHPTLAGLGSTRLHDEVAGSKAWLEDRLGVAIDSFAYPYGVVFSGDGGGGQSCRLSHCAHRRHRHAGAGGQSGAAARGAVLRVRPPLSRQCRAGEPVTPDGFSFAMAGHPAIPEREALPRSPA
jgi:peptidoglycan/xylan/chitin deacetylase (PgdA/CDA1 family)